MKKIIAVAAAAACLATITTNSPADAGENPFIGEVMMFTGNYCPRGYMDADGRLLSIGEHSTLFSILGTTFGGDGRTTFALPDLRGRMAIGHGYGPGLTDRRMGQKAGTETTTLTNAQMPSHSHVVRDQLSGTLRAAAVNGTQANPQGSALAQADGVYSSSNASVAMQPGAVTVDIKTKTTPAGGGQSFSIMNPYLTMRFCIAIFGLYPSRN
ncbi:MAG: tail fiber protein [Pseudomonadota bacterium]